MRYDRATETTDYMKNLSKNLLFAILILFFATTLFSFFLDGASPASESISLNALAQKINEGSVKRILVKGDELDVTFADDTKTTAQKEPNVGLTETLVNYAVDAEKLKSVELRIEEPGGTKYWASLLIPSLLPLIVMMAIFFFLFRQAKGGVNQAFTFGKANLRISAPDKDRVTFKEVAGLREAKEELEEIVDFLRNPKKFLDMGAKIPRGVLLMGSPGTGKTLLARAVAGESGVPFFHLSASEFVEMFVGVGASRVRDLFQVAKKSAPSIVFIDEIDAVGRERGTGLGGGHDEREQTLNQILVEMDGFDRDTNVIVMAATNRPDVLDAALLRPGRFDRRVMLDMPDINDREAILKIHAKGKPLSDDVDLRTVAVRTPGFAGAELANLMNEAALYAARHNRKKVTQEDILDSIEKVLLGPARKSRTITEHEKLVTAYHEAGHALVAATLEESDPVHKVTIVSRGFAGGYTLKLPVEERRLRTKSQFLSDLAVSFGGFAAETLIFKDVSTGSSNDLRQATDMAHKVVTQYGMSEKLGPRTFGKSQGMVFLGREMASEKDYSEKVAVTIDEEVGGLIKKGLETARKILTSHRKALDAIAHALMEKETLEQEEFYKLLEGFGIKKISLA
jgi:cell division protease FtsH